MIQANPVERTRPPKQTQRRVEAFTVEQVQQLFAEAEGSRYAPLLRFALDSGLRRGELLGLRWSDVDTDKGTVTVRRSRVLVGGKALVQEPKTEAGVRTVALPGLAMGALRAQKIQQAKDRLKAGSEWQGDGGWVFTNQIGGPLDPAKAYHAYARFRDRAALPRLPFHSLRHTAVSIQLAAQVPLETVSKRIGHRNLSTTADIYGHLLPEADRMAADKLDAYLREHGEKV